MVPGVRLGMHQRLGALVILRRPAFNEVASQGKRRADETDESLLVGELAQNDLNALADLGHVDVENRQVGHVLLGAHWGIHDGAATGDDLYAHARCLERDNDIAEENGAINIVAAHRLQGNLRQQLWHETGIQHADSLANLAVFRQGTTRLAHKPDGRAGRGTAGSGLNKRRGRQTRHTVHYESKVGADANHDRSARRALMKAVDSGWKRK